MSGPGTELKKIIPKFFYSTNCKCGDYADAMDKWGVDLCEQRKDQVIMYLVQQGRVHKLTKFLPEAVLKRQATNWVSTAIERARSSELNHRTDNAEDHGDS